MADLFNFVDRYGNPIEEKLHATEDSHGLMCPNDKQKLATIEEGATKTIVDSTLNSSSENPVQNKVITAVIGTKVSETDVLEMELITNKAIDEICGSTVSIDGIPSILDLELITIEDIDRICGSTL